MTRKDYELILHAIGYGLNRAAHENERNTGDRNSFHGNDLRVARLVAGSIAYAFAGELVKDNPRFNAVKFLAAAADLVGPQLDFNPNVSIREEVF